MSTTDTLQVLGWKHFFQQQLELDELETTRPVRVFSLSRHLLDVVGTEGPCQVTMPLAWQRHEVEERPTVGDWLLLEKESGDPLRLLERKSLFKRMASGRETRVQLMAANVDTLFVVTSCNNDFNLSRIERYLAMALDAEVEPLLVLTKTDLCEDVESYVAQARTLRAGLEVVALNAKDADGIEALRPWLGKGQTAALVGSSGVGKSTLVNSLCQDEVQLTGAIREADDKGRHTTTGRSLHLLPAGGLLLDSPGMRELQLSDCEAGVASLFDDFEELARQCRFNDCRHQGEKGCAIEEAREAGAIDERRLLNYLKLRDEQERLAQTLVEKRRKDKDFGKMVKRAMKDIKRKKGEF
ncbi:MAG: ribosome small subunit-dependent GTPase A [Desulfuromonas sp.]|nr:MAG: ribosome small subunit-dependent GTPase A [Desulfuromonas sp.]